MVGFVVHLGTPVVNCHDPQMQRDTWLLWQLLSCHFICHICWMICMQNSDNHVGGALIEINYCVIL